MADEDDRLFEANVDEGVEWVGLKENKSKETVGGGTQPNGDKEIMLSDEDSTYDTDEIRSKASSSDEETNTRGRPRWKIFRPHTDMEDPQFKLGMLFASSAELKAAIRQHSIKHQRKIKLLKNDKRRVKAVCLGKCSWLIYASRVKGEETYKVQTLNPKHTCGKIYSNRNVTSKVLAVRYLEELRTNPRWPLKNFRQRVKNDMGVHVTKNQVYRAKSRAAVLIYGDEEAQYGSLWNYAEEIKRTNPGSTVVMEAPLDAEVGKPRFKRFYVCLAACKVGFLQGCRKVVGLDGCHLKGPYPGQILAAVGIDPNNATYPVAYCIVEIENKETWTWFLHLLAMDLNITIEAQPSWTFINDRQKVTIAFNIMCFILFPFKYVQLSFCFLATGIDSCTC